MVVVDEFGDLQKYEFGNNDQDYILSCRNIIIKYNIYIILY